MVGTIIRQPMVSIIELERSPRTPAWKPESIRLLKDGSAIVLAYVDSPEVCLTAGRLRTACRCAGCRRAAHDGTRSAPTAGLSIKCIEAMGGHALNIAFSDGHARGLYPLDYLRSLAEPHPNHEAAR